MVVIAQKDKPHNFSSCGTRGAENFFTFLLTVDSLRYNVPMNEMFEISAQHRVSTDVKLLQNSDSEHAQTRFHQAEVKKNSGASPLRR